MGGDLCGVWGTDSGRFGVRGSVLTLPDAAQGDGGPVAAARAGVAREPRPLVLIAEDDELQRSLLRAYLLFEEFRVVACGDGERALHYCQGGGEIDLLISDIHMPYMDGDRLALAVFCQRPALPVILMSSEPPSVRSRALLAGRQWTFLQKPYTLTAMLELVHARLAGGRQRTASGGSSIGSSLGSSLEEPETRKSA